MVWEREAHDVVAEECRLNVVEDVSVDIDVMHTMIETAARGCGGTQTMKEVDVSRPRAHIELVSAIRDPRM